MSPRHLAEVVRQLTETEAKIQSYSKRLEQLHRSTWNAVLHLAQLNAQRFQLQAEISQIQSTDRRPTKEPNYMAGMKPRKSALTAEQRLELTKRTAQRQKK